MKHLLLPLLCVFFFTAVGHAQQNDPANHFEIKWGPEYKLPEDWPQTYRLADPEKGYVRVDKAKQTKLQITRFSMPGLKMTHERQFKIKKELGDGIAVDHFADLGGKSYMFYSRWDEATQKTRLFTREINLENGEFKGEGKQIHAVEGELEGTTVKSAGMLSFVNAQKYDFAFSNDSTRMLVVYEKVPGKDYESSDKLGVNVYDQNLNLLMSKELSFHQNDEDLRDNMNFRVDSKGNVYIIAKVHRTDDRNNTTGYVYEIMKVSPGADEPEQLTLDLDGRYVNQSTFQEDRQNNMLFVGYYSKRPGESSVDGIITRTIDQDFDVAYESTHEFSSEVLYKYEDNRSRRKLKKMAKNGETEVRDLALREVQTFDDGSFLVCGEEAYTYLLGSDLDYFCNDIYLAKMGPEGDHQWTVKVPKHQESQAGETKSISYKYWHRNGKNYLFYLDHKDNLSLKPEGSPKKHSDRQGGYLTVAVVENGDINKAHLFNVEDPDAYFFPTDIMQISSRMLIVNSIITGPGSHKMMKIKLK